MLEHMNILILRASYAAAEDGRLPAYLGSTIRGILGHCMRDFTCTAPTTRCYQCEQRNNCSYAECFCSTGHEAGAVNPFVLHVLVRDKTEWKAGDICTFDITLIGDMTHQAGLFLDALQAMGERGWGALRIPFSLEQVTDPVHDRLIYGGGKAWMRNIRPYVLECKERTATGVYLRFDTPVRILLSKNLCHTLSFDVLMQSLSRRISLLSWAYAGQQMQLYDKSMQEAAREITIRRQDWRYCDFERYSMNHKNNTLALPGIEGWAMYEGDITPFTPLIEAGRILHAGKNTTIGFGHYEAAYDR